jgi:hypothetical protein
MYFEIYRQTRGTSQTGKGRLTSTSLIACMPSI